MYCEEDIWPGPGSAQKRESDAYRILYFDERREVFAAERARIDAAVAAGRVALVLQAAQYGPFDEVIGHCPVLVAVFDTRDEASAAANDADDDDGWLEVWGGEAHPAPIPAEHARS